MKFKNETQSNNDSLRQLYNFVKLVLIKLVLISVWLTICVNEIGYEIKMKNKTNLTNKC